MLWKEEYDPKARAAAILDLMNSSQWPLLIEELEVKQELIRNQLELKDLDENERHYHRGELGFLREVIEWWPDDIRRKAGIREEGGDSNP